MLAVFEDDEVARLHAYLEAVDHLRELKIAQEGVPSSFEMRISGGKIEHIQSSVPPTEEIDALLHRLRPLILQEEPTSYQNVSRLLGKRFTSARVHRLLREQRRLFDGRNNQELVRITSNGTVINSETTLVDWLNGYEYHRDRDRRERIEALHRLLPLEHSMPTFLGLLADKVQAITQLAALIAVMLGLQDEVEVQPSPD